jgi:hypothetical protein
MGSVVAGLPPRRISHESSPPLLSRPRRRGRPAPGGVEYFPDADSGPADTEITAAILAGAAAIFQRGRQLRLV